MKKNKRDLIERHIFLEKWLKDNYPVNKTDNELIDYFSQYFNKHDVRYLINAYFLPKEDFDSRDAAHLDDLCFKYSITKERFFERISEVEEMNIVGKEKLKKPKLCITYDGFSDIIDVYIKRNKKDELDRKVLLEKWLDDNYIESSEDMINYIYYLFNKEDAEYLTRCYFMPRDEIISAIKKYNSNSMNACELIIQELMKKYDTDRNTVLSRLEEAVVINQLINEEKKDINTSENIKKREKAKKSCIKW